MVCEMNITEAVNPDFFYSEKAVRLASTQPTYRRMFKTCLPERSKFRQVMSRHYSRVDWLTTNGMQLKEI